MSDSKPKQILRSIYEEFIFLEALGGFIEVEVFEGLFGGPFGALFEWLLEGPFEVLIEGPVGRLLEESFAGFC